MNNENRRSRKGSKEGSRKNDGQIIPKNSPTAAGIPRPKAAKTQTGKPRPKAARDQNGRRNDHRTTEGPQAKKNPRNKIKAHSGRNTKPGRPARDPESIRTDKKHRTTARTAENSQNHRTNAQKPRHGAKRPKTDKIHTKATKRHHGRNMKPTDKRRTQTPENIEKSKIRHLFTWDSKGRQNFKLNFFRQGPPERHPGGYQNLLQGFAKNFSSKKIHFGRKNFDTRGRTKK